MYLAWVQSFITADRRTTLYGIVSIATGHEDRRARSASTEDDRCENRSRPGDDCSSRHAEANRSALCNRYGHGQRSRSVSSRRTRRSTLRSNRQVVARALRETHHASVLENWGLLWMWHSLALIIACFATWWLQHAGTDSRIPYATLWIVGTGCVGRSLLGSSKTHGTRHFVERQIAHVWGASMIAIALVFPLEWWLDLKPLTLSPMLGIITGMVFLIKAGILWEHSTFKQVFSLSRPC